jgi:protoporphyrinogen oxidase
VGAKVDGLLVEDNRVKGVRVGADTLACDHLVLTIPLPSLRPLVENLEGTYWDNIRRLQSIGIVALLLRIRQRFSEYFWTNISDPRVQLAGVIEYTNLNPCPRLGGHSLVYLPHYVTDTHPMFAAKDEDILKENCRYLQIVNPDFDPSWVEQHWVYRDRFAQPICEVGFSNRLPAMQTPIENMYLTDSHQLHPHDRSISASTDLGEEVADLVLRKTNTPTVG